MADGVNIRPLVLRRDREGGEIYHVYCDGRIVGTILFERNAATANCWGWSLNDDYAGPQPMGGHATSREEAMKAVRAAWDKHGVLGKR
jgi:hypothetical protein